MDMVAIIFAIILVILVLLMIQKIISNLVIVIVSVFLFYNFVPESRPYIEPIYKVSHSLLSKAINESITVHRRIKTTQSNT